MNILLSIGVASLFAKQPQTAKPLNIEQIVQIALRANQALKTAELDLRVSLTGFERDRPTMSPSVTAEAIGTIQTPTVLAPQVGGTVAPFEPGRYGKIEVRLDQLLYKPGLNSAKTRYRSENMTAFWLYEKKRSDIILDCRRAFLQLKRAKLMHAVAQSGLDLAVQQYSLIKTMLVAGTSTERDLKASDSDVAEAELGVLKSANGVTLAAMDLNRQLGRDGSDIQISDEDETMTNTPEFNSSAITATDRRPEAKLLKESLIAARSASLLAATQNKPTVSARASAITQTPGAYTDARYLAGSLVLTWHPFDNNKTRNDVNEANANIAQIVSEQRELEMGIRIEVRKAILDMNEASSRVTAISRQVSSAQKSYDISKLRFENSSTTQLEVSSALFALIKANRNKTEAEIDRLLAQVELQHAMGVDVESETVSNVMFSSKGQK